MPRRHLVLVGLPGSGKSTVGNLASRKLGAAFSDIDLLVAAAAGRPVPDIFASLGEAEFRRLERAAVLGALAAPPHLIAPGAGWIAEPGNLESAARAACLVYLRVSPETAADRLAPDDSRPLLRGGDRVARLRELLEQREPWYRRAAREVDASGAAEAVAEAVAGVARDSAGW
jgi:shikimate kinase